MSRFVNTENKVVVSVADDKDERFSSELWSSQGSTGSSSKTDTAVGDADSTEGQESKASSKAASSRTASRRSAPQADDATRSDK